MVELKISNLSARVRFPLPAPSSLKKAALSTYGGCGEILDNAAVAKLVYAQDLKSCGLKNRVGPIPASGTLSK